MISSGLIEWPGLMTAVSDQGWFVECLSRFSHLKTFSTDHACIQIRIFMKQNQKGIYRLRQILKKNKNSI